MDEQLILDLIEAVGGLGAGIFLFTLLVLFILIPFSAYSAQKWAYRSYKELRKIREHLEAAEDRKKLVSSNAARSRPLRQEPTVNTDI